MDKPKTEILEYNVNWNSIKRACMRTVGLNSGDKEPPKVWKRKLLICRHSPSWTYIKDRDTVIQIIDEPPSWNECVWNCIYKKDLIGDNRFDETKRYVEDTIFNYQVRKGKKEIIDKILYLYNTGRPGNLSSLMR